MTEVKEAPKTKTGNGHGQTKELARAAPASLQPAEAGRLTSCSFAEEMDRVFEDFGHETAWHLPGLLARGRRLFRRARSELDMAWSPRIDVHAGDGKFVVHAELPGMSKDEVKVEVVDDVLTIEGEGEQAKTEEREGYSYSDAGMARSIAAFLCRRGSTPPRQWPISARACSKRRCHFRAASKRRQIEVKDGK